MAFVSQYITLVLMAGIDKEWRKINTSVLLFGAICQLFYMIYLYIIEKTSMYRYMIYFVLFMLLFILLAILQKKKEHYILQILLLLTYIAWLLDWKAIVPICILSFVTTLILHVISKKEYQLIPFGFAIGFSTIVYQIVENFIEFWRI